MTVAETGPSRVFITGRTRNAGICELVSLRPRRPVRRAAQGGMRPRQVFRDAYIPRTERAARSRSTTSERCASRVNKLTIDSTTMIICLSGFVIAGAGTSPTSMSFACRNDILSQSAAHARYSPAHHQLLAQLAGGAGSSGSSGGGSPPPALAAPPAARRVRTLYACLGESEGELSFEPNQVITNVAASGEPGWLHGELDGRRGLVPENYVEPLP